MKKFEIILDRLDADEFKKSGKIVVLKESAIESKCEKKTRP